MFAAGTDTRRKALVALAVVTALLAGSLHGGAFTGDTAHAGSPAGTSTAAVSNIFLIEETDSQDWLTVLQSTIKPPGGNRALFIDVSLMCGLYTQTLVKTREQIKDTSTAEGTVTVRVLLNGQDAYPGEVIFCNRMQELSAELQGVVEESDGEQEVTDDETIETIQRTMAAHAFNFVAHPLDPGTVYDIQVQAKIETNTDSQNGLASAYASVGRGSVTVDAVRLVKGDQVLTGE